MTQTNTDYLFQLTGPVADRNLSAASPTGGADKFGDHLSQASANAREDSNQHGVSSQGPGPAVPNERRPVMGSYRDYGPRNTGAARSAAKEKVTSSPEKQSSRKQNDSAHVMSHRKESTDEVDTNDRDDDLSDGKVANEQAAAMQAVSVSAPQAATAPIVITTLMADTGANDRAGDKNAESDAPLPSIPQAIEGNASAPQSELHLAERSAVFAAVDGAADQTKVSAATSAETKQSQPPPAAIEQSKYEKTAGPLSNSKSDADATQAASQNEPPAIASGTAEITANAAPSTASQSQVKPTLPDSTAANGVSKRDEASQDDSRDGSRAQATSSVSSDAIAQSNKAVIVPVVNVAAANSGDAPTNDPPKGEKNGQAAKSITGQGDLAAASFARLTRTNAGAGRSSQAATNNEAPLVDPTRFVGRVAKAFQTAHDRGGTLQLRLSPPELGSLRLELTVKDGVMSASLQTENANARRLLLDHLPALRDRLAEQNIRVDRFDVDIRQEGSGSHADTRGSQQHAFQHQPDHPAPRRQPAPQPQPREAVRPETLTTIPITGDNGLNLIV